MKKLISIGCCCYNEEGNIEETYNQLKNILSDIPQYNFEIIFEDNASTDKTPKLLRGIAEKDKRVKVIFNQSNYGIANSRTNLLLNISGDAYISIPADLQEPLEMIPEFISYWEQGYDAAWGQKTRSEEKWFKYLCRSVYYSIIDFLSEYKQLHQTTGFGITDRAVIDAYMITRIQDPDVELRHWIVSYGYKIRLIPYIQKKRTWGATSYTAGKSMDFAITSLCNTSTRPLRIMTVLGAATGVLCIFVSFAYLIYKLLHWNTFNVGMAPLIIGIFFVMAVQLFCIGILGEYISVLLRKITNKVTVIEKERLNFDETDNTKQ